MKVFRALHWSSFGIGILSILLPILFWSKIPEKIPMHYNAKGVIDNWSNKSSIILLFFCIVMLMGIMAIAVYVVKTNMESQYSQAAEKTVMSIVYKMVIVMNFLLQCMFAYIVFCVVTCRTLGTLFLPIMVVAIFIPIFYMLYKSGQVRTVKKSQKMAYKMSEKQEKGTVYRTAVDWWLGAILIGCEVLVWGMFLWPLITSGEFEFLLLLSAIGTTLVIVPLFDIKYTMYSEHLLISVSVLGRVRVRYEDIVDVKESMNALSSAAMSLYRIQIDYVENGIHKMVLISPKRRKEFIAVLEERRHKDRAVN